MMRPLILWPLGSTVMPSAPITSPFPGQSSRSVWRMVLRVRTDPQPTGWPDVRLGGDRGDGAGQD
jgi:hypothetical protein